MKQLGRTGEIHNRRLELLKSISAVRWKAAIEIGEKAGVDLRALEKRGVVKVNRVKGRLPWYRLSAGGLVAKLFCRRVDWIAVSSRRDCDGATTEPNQFCEHIKTLGGSVDVIDESTRINPPGGSVTLWPHTLTTTKQEGGGDG